MPRLSIVIPVLGEPRPFEDTLVSVLENLPPDCQVLVAMNRPYDDPYELAGEVEFLEAPAKSCLVGVVNRALAACRAPLVHVLGCGLRAGSGWIDAALTHFDDPRIASVTPLVLQRQTPDRLVSAGLTYSVGGVLRRHASRQRLDLQQPLRDPLGPELAAAFYRRSAVAAVGGLDDRLGDAWAAADLALRLEAAGFECRVASECRVTADGPAVSIESALRRGWHAERFFWRWAPRQGWLGALAAHALHVGGTLATGLVRPGRLVEVVGRAIALTTIPAQRSARRTTFALPTDVACEESQPLGDRRAAA